MRLAASERRRVHAASRQLAKRYHPDVNPAILLPKAASRRLADAYATLSDAGRRAALDHDRAGAEWSAEGMAPAGPRPYYSDDVGYTARRDDDLDSLSACAARAPGGRIGGWPVAVCL